MRKFTFFLAMLVAMVTTSMAQTLEFTFNKVSASEATVTVTGNEVEAGGITATIASNQPWKALTADSQTFPNASIVCPDKNTNTMTAGSEGTITLTLNNVPEGYSFRNVTFTSVALNGSGAFQADDANAQHVNFTLTKGETTLGVAENVKIKVNSNGGESVVLPFEVAEAYTAENGTLELKLTLSITEPKGCFYGLIKVAIDTEVAPAEPELPALEITGYTPTEAVEKLETITITFNDEIEGTFDMMAMSQIYLGSRSNGCSFAVDGNVLTITPFNAITTPGEYGLVIPEGLITRKANGEKISLNKEITFTVKEAIAALEITGYTPVEAVEKLETITITFNDEIEGTFDMMAMSQIYLGSRSNGCSFAVEGNVLTINPFNAITTPGEYGLVIPEGLITRKANGEKISMNKEIVFTVKEATVEPEPEVTYYRIKTTTATGDAIYLNIGNTDEHQTGPKGGVNIVAYAEDDNQLFTIEEAGEGKIYLKSKSGYYIKGWAWNVDGSASQKSELEFEDAGEGTFYIKGENGYFKVEYVGDAYYPFCDAPISAAAKWTLEQVGAAEPELPALEITGYTPTEAVEKLETITITFNDEIEGTFEMMAMSQIYLGAKSNGCSFAVEGNVLTITPFNAITTPGEYALVIPEGLITRKANGETIALNGEITFTVKEATVEPEPTVPVVITSVDQLSNSKLYTITSSDAGRGNFYALDSKVDMCAVTYSAGADACHKVAYNAEEPKQQFAFVNYEDKFYLYSVSEKKFVAKNGNVNKLTAEAPFEFVVVESVSENTFALMLNGTHYMTASPGWCSNAERNTCIQTTLTDHNSDNGWDNGAWFTITEVGEFDAIEAIAMLTPAEPEVEPLEVVSISPADGETVEKLEQIVVTFNAPVTLDETKNINLVAAEITPIEAYAGKWEVTSSWPGYPEYDYSEIGTIEVIDYAGVPALLCTGFSGYNYMGYDDSFLMMYNSEDGTVSLESQQLGEYDYYGTVCESILACGNTVEGVVFAGSLVGKIENGNIVFESAADNKYVADSWMFYAIDLNKGISYFNSLVWTPAAQAAAPAKAAVRNNFKVEFAKNLSVAAFAKSKISRADENVANIVSAAINPDDATQLIITVNEELANGAYDLIIEEGAVVTAEGAANAAIKCRYYVEVPTGIEGVEAEVENVIYDLTGRKIETITKGGIYIVNGKKVLVK